MKSLSKTPAPAKDRIYGSNKNPKGSASSEKSAKDINLSSDILVALTRKLKEFRGKHKNQNVSLSDLKAVYRRGLGAYSSTHRPTISGGKPNTRNAWAMARVNAFLRKAGGGEAKESYVQDDDLVKMHLGGDMSKHLAPNGKLSNLTHEQWHLVRTPEFKAWFGDWENNSEEASKVVDSNGEPLVVYHGTPNGKFNVFDREKSYDKTFYFTKDKDYADRYSNDNPNFGRLTDNSYVFQVFLNLRNPLKGFITNYENYGNNDGAILGDGRFVVLNSNQIKLADGTNTTFDGGNPDIRYADGGEVDEHKETYKKWKSLVNMSNAELRRFYDSEEGKKAGLKPSEAKAQGIDSGRESARWIMKMKSTPVSKWTPAMWKWAKKQISFISRMSGMKGDLYDEKGRKTRKHLSLLIWGHNPKKYKAGGINEAFADRYEKNKWVNINIKDLHDFKDEIFDLIANSYSHVGGNLEFQKPMDVANTDLDIWFATDIDSDPYIDALIGAKTTKNGTKLTTIAQDGENTSKLILLKKVKDLMKERGFYAEVSKDMADKLNVPIIKDKAIITKVVNKPDITFNADGSYDRSIHGKKVTKVLVGVLNNIYKSGGETKTDMKFNEPIMYHEKNGNFFVGKNTIYYWLYDDKEAGKKLNDGDFDFVMFPPATLSMASQKGFVPPLQLIWTKKYQNKTKGSEHLIGIIEAFLDEENKKLYIKMMTTNPKMKGKGIMTYLVKTLREEFGLSQDDVIFVNTTKEGKRFEEAKHYDYGGELEKLGFTEEEIQNWKKQNKVSQRQEQNPNVKKYALKLKSGEISQDEYIKAVRKYLPIIPFTEVPQIPTLLEIVGALDSNKVEKGIIGYTQFINDGEYVASRLDIPAYNNYDVWVVSVHDGMKEGNSIGYGQTAYLKNVDFKVFPKTALNIAIERTDKTPFARIFGYWINKDPHEVREMAVKYMNDPEWVQVGMNPYRHSWFYDKSDGMPLLTAEEVIQVGALVLAKNPVKTTPDNPVFAVDKNNPDIKFKKGGIFKKHKSIEQISKEKNVSLSYAKEQLKKGMKIESEHSDSKEVQETIALQHLDEMINYYDKLKTIEN